jgi:hypothetical protein
MAPVAHPGRDKVPLEPSGDDGVQSLVAIEGIQSYRSVWLRPIPDPSRCGEEATGGLVNTLRIARFCDRTQFACEALTR